MTKTRARERAKANAAKKSKKRKANAAQADESTQSGHFDPGSQSIKGPGTNKNTAGFGPAKRGSARSG